MTTRTHLLAIDQGTSSSRAIVFDDEARPLASAQAALAQSNPQPGWVEQDPTEMATQTIAVARKALRDANVGAESVAAIGIAVQRETAVIWDRRTGAPLTNAIVWQDRRTAARCEQLQAAGHTSTVWSNTGLVIDPYFSATKFEWLLQNAPAIDVRRRAERGEIALGTVDSWLIDQLCRNPDRATDGNVPHLTDVSNASRTMLLDVHDMAWSPELLELFGIPEAALPQVVPSAGVVAETHPRIFGRAIPIAGVAGDQQAATFGQACFSRGDLKCTYGTGAFILANAGASSDGLFRMSTRTDTGDPLPDAAGLLFTAGWQTGGSRAYCVEGSVFSTGATVQWLRDRLGIIDDPAETTAMATMVGDSEGVYLVPAFNGLGTPHWDPNARATISGMSSATDRNHIARAALESTAYQVHDVVQLMRERLRQSSTNRSRRASSSTTAAASASPAQRSTAPSDSAAPASGSGSQRDGAAFGPSSGDGGAASGSGSGDPADGAASGPSSGDGSDGAASGSGSGNPSDSAASGPSSGDGSDGAASGSGSGNPSDSAASASGSGNPADGATSASGSGDGSRSRRSQARTRPLRADGGQTRNPFLMQFQADILDLPVEVPEVDETTALGAAYLAGIGTGIWRNERELAALRRVAQTYEPEMPESRRLSLLAGWQEAVRRTRTDYAGM